MNNLNSDKPAEKKDQDRFQRSEFSKRIAQAIIERKSKECVVIGIYGVWGEGKTSVLNFIDNELRAHDIKPVRFNPWRYNDEDKLIINLLSKICDFLGESLTGKFQRLGEILTVFGNLGNRIGFDLTEVGKKLAEVNLEELKEQVSSYLEEKELKLVIFIDDIDRLDKNEIHAVFRLVKLTADFSNTTYVLAFDDDMVSSAIGERFGTGSQKSGQSFLEKIIQVPLRLPKAPQPALAQFSFELIYESLKSNHVILTDVEKREFSYQFSRSILIRLDTPRLAVRYVNTLSFSVPLLVGEVNIIDLLLIEAVKVFYPNHYKFISDSPSYFIESYSDPIGLGRNQSKTDAFKSQWNKISVDFNSNEQEAINKLLMHLFPRLKDAYFNPIQYGESAFNTWVKEQRICTYKYFDKYFSYSVKKGDVSDNDFKNFLETITNQNDEDIEKSFKSIVYESNTDDFLFKIMIYENSFNWELSQKIIKGLYLTSSEFPETPFIYSGGIRSLRSQAALLILEMLKRHLDREGQFEVMKEILQNSDLNFALEVDFWFQNQDEDVEIYSDLKRKDLISILVNRAIDESNGKPIFETFPENAAKIYSLWSGLSINEFEEHISRLLNESPNRAIDLLKTFTPNFSINDGPMVHKSDFSEHHYQVFKSVFDVNQIYTNLRRIYSEEELNAEKATLRMPFPFTPQTDLNLIRQFLHWYQKEQVETSLEGV